MAIDKPIVVVVHATSKQGTSVVNSLLQTDSFTVKAITRKPGSDSALEDGCLPVHVLMAEHLQNLMHPLLLPSCLQSGNALPP